MGIIHVKIDGWQHYAYKVGLVGYRKSYQILLTKDSLLQLDLVLPIYYQQILRILQINCKLNVLYCLAYYMDLIKLHWL